MADPTGTALTDWDAPIASPLHALDASAPTSTSVYLFEDLISNEANGAYSGWQCFDSPRHLAEYLLHVGIPDLARWWFDPATYLTSEGRLTLRDTVAAAADAGPADRAFFIGLADDLDAIVAVPGPADFTAVSNVVERFTARCGAAVQASFTLIVFPDARAAGIALWERQERVVNPVTDEDLSCAEWLDLCDRVGDDVSAGELVAAVFEEAYTV